MKITEKDLFDFLEEKADEYNRPLFIELDPISIPHLFTKKEDIEIAGFLTASIAWGQRQSIIKNAQRLVGGMGHRPYEFVMQASGRELEAFRSFVHRTFNGTDCMFFLQSLRNVYEKHGGLEKVFVEGLQSGGDMSQAISRFKKIFFEMPHPARSQKHVADPLKGSSAKRLNMYLRWMVRKDKRRVDFGIWDRISPSALYCPLDLHSGRVARKLGLLEGKQNNWKAVQTLTSRLRNFDPADPVKYDFALFGLGIFENF
jgi:uncharacterized protein (TIGR02757 family)